MIAYSHLEDGSKVGRERGVTGANLATVFSPRARLWPLTSLLYHTASFWMQNSDGVSVK